jgi:hypothetical protein
MNGLDVSGPMESVGPDNQRSPRVDQLSWVVNAAGGPQGAP